MATLIDFYGPKLKTERAEHHLGELDRIFRDFVRKNRESIAAKATEGEGKGRPLTIGGAFPRHTPTVIGDVVHNLRAALDHAYCILVEANGHTINRYTSFPFGKDRDSVAGSINGQIAAGHGPSDKVRDAILGLIEPFTGGKGERLYGIHKLDVTDKHEVLIPTATKFSLSGLIAVLPNGNRMQIADFDVSSLGPDVQKKGLMVFGSEVRLIMNQNAKVTFDIGFQQGQPFEGQSIVHTLRNLLVLTRGALEVLRTA
jgi:hypothetical protein